MIVSCVSAGVSVPRPPPHHGLPLPSPAPARRPAGLLAPGLRLLSSRLLPPAPRVRPLQGLDTGTIYLDFCEAQGKGKGKGKGRQGKVT